MSLNALSCNHTNVQLAFGESALCGRLNKAGKGVCVAITLVVFNTLMLLSGAAEDAFSLEALLSDNTFVEPLLLTIAEFLAYPIISSQLLIGLCWLLFHTFSARRAVIILRKAAFAFSARLKLANQCKPHMVVSAPPSFTGCL